MNSINENPQAPGINGKTIDAGRELVERMLSIFSHSRVDPGRAGVIRSISTTYAAWRRAVSLAYPLPDVFGHFPERMQSEVIRRTGEQLLFDPRMRIMHDFYGWSMEIDIRRYCGYGTVIVRLHDQALPFSWKTCLGAFSIPMFVFGKPIKS